MPAGSAGVGRRKRMAKKWKIALFAAGGIFALLILAAVALVLFVDVNAHKPRLEAAASDALGMEVRIGGRLGIGLFPGFHVTIEDVRIRNRGMDIVSVANAAIGIELLPLLHKEVRIVKIGMKRPRISIERDRDGKFNFETPEEEAGKKPPREAEGTLPELEVGKVSLSGGTLLYTDKKSGEVIEAGDFNLDVSPLRLSGGKPPDLLKHLSFTAEFDCKELRMKNLAVSGLKFSVVGKDGVLDIKPFTMHIFGGQGSGSIRADLSGPVPLLHLSYSLTKFRFEEFLKSLSPQKTAEGPMDFSAILSMRGKTAKEMERTADGDVSLRGEDLTMHGIDLDRTLSRLESSQNFNPVDLGAFFFAGPFGPMLTKGYNFASVFQGTGGGQQGPEARLRLEGGTRRGQGEGRCDGDEREPDRAYRKTRFRQRAVRRRDSGADRRKGVRQSTPENPRSLPETGGGKGECSPNGRGAGAFAVQAGEETLVGRAVRSVLRRLGGGPEMKKEQSPAIIEDSNLGPAADRSVADLLMGVLRDFLSPLVPGSHF
ncbi:MAG: hypothetical protein HW408_1081 [Actinobacteria bacterium]|nr:hypothetical protein [Actinomycetota bacterium]